MGRITWAKLARLIKAGKIKEDRIDWPHRNKKKARNRRQMKLRRRQLQKLRRREK